VSQEHHSERSPAESSTRSPEEQLAEFVAACGGAVRQSGKETVCRCPAHEDETPSLNVCLGDDDSLLVKCRAGCDTTAVVKKIGWKLSDLMALGTRVAKRHRARPRKRSKTYSSLEDVAAAAAAKWKGSVESTHVYGNEHGEPVFGVVRVRRADGSKDVPQIRPHEGGWAFGGLKGKKGRPLYRLPELLAAPADVPWCMFEGEQKADLAASLGLTATSCSQGAGKANLTDLAPLGGHVVHLFADNDTKGADHMLDVARRAYATGASAVWSVKLPNLHPKGDIVNFVETCRESGMNDEQIADAIRSAVQTAEFVGREPIEKSDGGDSGDEPDDAPPPATVADQLVVLAAEAELFHDEHDEPYASILVDTHRETWRIASEHFGRWLCSRYYRKFKMAVPPTAMATAIGQLSAMAQFDGRQDDVHLRVARTEGGLYLDLCNSEWQAVEITKDSWRVVDGPPVRFVRRQGMKALPTPTTGLNSLDPLFDLLHLQDRDLRLLITAWMVNALTSSSSYPIVAFSGEQGSGKTTFCRAIQRLIDPHEMEGRSPPRSEEDIAVAAQHAHLIVYENLSGVTPQLSDALCRVATGAGFAARKLYTNDEERQLKFCRPILVNGIDDLVTRSDMADRAVSVQLPTIERSRRRTESELWASFDALRPQLLGALLDLLVQVLRQPRPDVQLERMADYSLLGAKVAVALGHNPSAFCDAYRLNRDDASVTTLETNPIGPVLRRLVRRGPFAGQMAGLLHELRQAATAVELRHPEWPRSPRALGDCLRRLNPDLARVGIIVTYSGRRRDGYWLGIEETHQPHVHDVHNAHGDSEMEVSK